MESVNKEKMKNLKSVFIICLLLTMCYSVSGQFNLMRVDTSIIRYDNDYADTLSPSVCDIKGHVSNGIGSVTLAYCEPYLIDTDTCTIMVYPSCNYMTYSCLRCEKIITEKIPERRVVIWRKEWGENNLPK